GSRFRRDVDLAPQAIATNLIWAKRQVLPCFGSIEAHQRPMARFVQWIERQQVLSGCDGTCPCGTIRLKGEQLAQDLHGASVDSLPLGCQPFGEALAPEVKTLQKVAFVEPPGL